MKYENISYESGAGLLRARKVILSQSGLIHKGKINGVHSSHWDRVWGGGGSGNPYLSKMSPTLPKAFFFKLSSRIKSDECLQCIREIAALFQILGYKVGGGDFSFSQ